MLITREIINSNKKSLLLIYINKIKINHNKNNQIKFKILKINSRCKRNKLQVANLKQAKCKSQTNNVLFIYFQHFIFNFF